jgi:hypothetical protein
MKTTVAGTAAASLLALFGFLGSEPITWPRAAVLIAGCVSLAALGIFAQSSPPAKPAPSPSQPLPAVLAPPAIPSRPEADKPAQVGP